MIHVKIKTDQNLKLNIPIPYAILQAGCSLLSSELVLPQLTKWTTQYSDNKSTASFMPLNSKLSKQMIKQTIRELRHHKGLVIVDVKMKDGTEVFVRL